ncbi:hypothetical protein TRFO_08421 [Tritrichomonas foetus]|uniref:Uncharacterized protein n=1 Tax=Tritrichomonas foetus TaxID=1144522 RepID=A0A1J4JM21_9EUKA|nr:hypothetical protein TRFO_08421 [Tritrichomonas foetus]|eukprot:OHS99471.1 hypothetical protein TRFO_08421 [Tritrichomonas foetus]
MDNPLAALLQVAQQQTSINSPLESLASALREKENKLQKLRKDYSDLEDEFQTNYDFIIKRDAKIEELKGILGAKDSEMNFVNTRIKQSQDELNHYSERITTFQKKIDDLLKSTSMINKEITQIQFNTTRLKETKLPVMQIPESKETLDKLNATHSDLLKRKDMIFNIVNDIYNQSTLSSNETRTKYQREVELTYTKLQEYDNVHESLLNAIRSVEQQTHDALNQIEIQKQQINDQYNVTDESKIQITQMKQLLSEIDKEIDSLLVEQKEGQETDLQRQEFYQTQAQRLTKLEKDLKEKISNFKVTIHTQKVEIQKLQNKFEAQRNKNDECKSVLDQILCGFQKPNFQQVLYEEKEKLNDKFARCTKKQLRAQQKLKDQQSNLDDQIEKQKQLNLRLTESINQIVAESRKRTEIVNRERKRSKLISLEIKSAEGELSALREYNSFEKEPPIKIPMPELPTPPSQEPKQNQDHLISRNKPPPPIQIPSPPTRQQKQSFTKPKPKPKKDDTAQILQLTQQLEQIADKMNQAKVEMQQLKEKETSIQRDIIMLREENNQLRKSVENYDEIKRYYLSMQKIGSIPIPLPKKQKK